MKILGKTGEGYILEASNKELAHLVGFFSEYEMNYLIVGTEIEINHMYNQLYDLSHMENDLQQIADKLEKYAETLRPLMPLHIECPTKGE